MNHQVAGKGTSMTPWIGEDQETGRRVRKLNRWQPDWLFVARWVSGVAVSSALGLCVYLYVWQGWLR